MTTTASSHQNNIGRNHRNEDFTATGHDETKIERAMKKLGVSNETSLEEICDVVTQMFSYGGVAYMPTDWREHRHLTRRQADRLFESYFRGFRRLMIFGTGPGGIVRYGCSRFKVHYYLPELQTAFDLTPKVGMSPSRVTSARIKDRFFRDMKITYISLLYSELYKLVVQRIKKIIECRVLDRNDVILAFFIGDTPIEFSEGIGQIFEAIFGDTTAFGNLFKDSAKAAVASQKE